MPTVSIEAHNATWKTGFAYSQPLPIFGFQFDMGFDRAINGTANKMFAGLKVNVHTYESGEGPKKFWNDDDDIVVCEVMPPLQLSEINEGYNEAWDYFMAIYGYAVRDKRFSSYVLDTATSARKFKADAHLESLQKQSKAEGKPIRKQLQQVEWGKPNTAIKEIYDTMGAIRKNFVSTHWLTDEYVKGIVNGNETMIPSGKFILEGWNDTHDKVDMALRFDKSLVEGKTQVKARFEKCGYNTDLEARGIEVLQPTWDKVMHFVNDTLGGRLDFQYREK